MQSGSLSGGVSAVLSRRWSRAGWLRLTRLPAMPAAVIALLYLIWLELMLPHSHGARDFINIGRNYLLAGQGSTAIHLDAYSAHLPNPGGFDGQFSYYIALDPLHAASYLDDAAYRYTRVLYPLLARLLALGNSTAIPYTLVAVNYLALAGGTLALATWLSRKGLSVWWALIFGLYPGFFEGLRYDLTEPLGYALIAVAVFLYDFGPARGRLVMSALCMALAVLARETTAIFPVVYGLALLIRPASGRAIGTQPPDDRALLPRDFGRRIEWSRAVGFLLLSCGPMALYKLLLLATLGSFGIPAWAMQTNPFSGIRSYYPWSPPQLEIVRSVYLPGLIGAGVCLWALARRCWGPAPIALLLNV
jgi:hypothetical protein